MRRRTLNAENDMTYPTSPAAETAEGLPKAMADIIDSLKRLERIGDENSKTVEKILEAARDLEAKIAILYEGAENTSILGAVTLARIVKENHCSLAAAARSLGLDHEHVMRMRYSVEPSASGGYLLGPERTRVSQSREAALRFANDLAHGLLVVIQQDLMEQNASNRAALDVLNRIDWKHPTGA